VLPDEALRATTSSRATWRGRVSCTEVGVELPGLTRFVLSARLPYLLAALLLGLCVASAALRVSGWPGRAGSWWRPRRWRSSARRSAASRPACPSSRWPAPSG